MSDQNALFRKAALDKLASPERLDVLMQVTSPQGWAALWTIAALLAAAIAWSIFGEFDERIDGQGVLLSGGGTRQIRAGGDGVLTKFQLAYNDVVQADQVVGAIEVVGTEENVRMSEERLLESKRNATASELEDRGNIRNLDLQIAVKQTEREEAASQLKEEETKLAERQAALKNGLVTANAVQTAQDRVNAAKGRISLAVQTVLNLQSQKVGIEQRIRSRNQQVSDDQRRSESTKTTAAASTEVRTTVAGRVIELLKRQGERVKNGDVVAVIEPPGSEFEAVVYVSSDVGKRIKEKMPTQISPSGVKREEFGYMKGTIARVADYAATQEAAVSAVGNPELVKKFLGGGPKFELRVAPTADPNTPSGFAWSSSKGPPLRITSGTEVTLAIIVDSHPPIQEVLPFLKKMIGAS
jgi:HlyD family secretion protein